MNYLHTYLNFTTVTEGEEQLKQAYALRDQMGGQLYYGILSEDCHEISNKVEELRRQERKNPEPPKE